MTACLIFWISLGLLAWCYAVYGIVLFMLNSVVSLFAKKKTNAVTEEIPVTLIITAYQESAILPEKIRNTAAIDYPAGLLTVLLVTDGSEEDLSELLKPYPFIRQLHQPERKGKYAALKRAIPEVNTTVVFFSDANTMLNADCIRKMMVHYQDPKVGAVAGEKKIQRTSPVLALGEAEGLYWKYESFLKKQDAGFYTVVGAAGELFSIRTELFKPLDADIILDDFIISMQVCLSRHRIAYEPGAFATEWPSASLHEEAKRKIRIAAGAYQSMAWLWPSLNIFKYPLLAFQFFSRRVIRWFFSPFLLPVILAANAWIVWVQTASPVYAWILVSQGIFYLFAIAGWAMVYRGKPAGIFTIPFYFLFMNYCQARGFFRWLGGKQSATWEKSLRQVVEQAP